jgi:hypothetical protein
MIRDSAVAYDDDVSAVFAIETKQNGAERSAVVRDPRGSSSSSRDVVGCWYGQNSDEDCRQHQQQH